MKKNLHKSNRGGARPGAGRPQGSPNKATREIKTAFKRHGTALVKALLKLTKSDDERVRLGAINACLDRGWGKAVQSMELDMNMQVTAITRTIVRPKMIEHEPVKVFAEAEGKT